MPKRYSSKQITRVLRQRGFNFVAQKGSHAKFRRTGTTTLTVIVPMNRKEIPFGTFRSIIRQAQLNENDFE
ncbi:MAG: type II toxin-antitoxin system HicA family toxin [Patescibacteria group bacterium]